MATAPGVPRAAVLLIATALLSVLTPVVAPLRFLPINDTAAEPAALDMVVLVDQSGSLSDDDVTRERQAVSTIAQSGLSSRSRVTVVGFGSNNGLPGQAAVTQFCRPTVLDSALARQYLAECTGGIVRRTLAQGNDTDHAAALAQAMTYFGQGSPEGAFRAVFLLTDGRLDVHNSPNYGSREADRNAAAQVEVTRQLAQAARLGVQVWPLGFGSQVDEATLARFAADGAQASASCATPHARVVGTSADVRASLLDAYASVTCSRQEPWVPGTLRPGSSTELSFRISPLATDGTILVSKGDPRVRVDYLDPSGQQVPFTGSRGESTFGRSGENTSVESLRVINPDPGTWTVRLTAPNGLDQQTVGATVVWQGALRSSIVVEPPAPKPGQQVTVRLVLLTRVGPVTDPEVLKNLVVSVSARPQGSDPTTVAVRDDGKQPDDRAGDGTFSGTLTTPRATGDLTVTGMVTGPGVYARNLPLTLQVADTSQRPIAQLRLDVPDELWAGQDITGMVSVENPTNALLRARLVMSDVSPGVRMGVSPPAVIDLPVGSSARDIVLTLQPGSTLGGSSFTLQLVDDSSGAVYGNVLVNFVVRTRPGVIESNRMLIIAVLGVLALAAVVLLALRQRHRARVDVRGLRTVLTAPDSDLSCELKAPRRWSDEFRFTIRDPDHSGARIEHPRSDDLPYVVRRSGRNRVSVRTPDGERMNLAVGGSPEPLPAWPEVLLAFRDERRRGPRAVPRPTARTGRPKQAEPPGQAEQAASMPVSGEDWM